MLIPKRNQFLQEISKESRKNIGNGFCGLFNAFLGSLSTMDPYVCLFIIVFIIFIFVLFLYGIIGPYVAFILSFHTEKILIILNAFHNTIWHTISLLGYMGKVQCCCLYRPDNWLFLMIFSDFMCFGISFTTAFATLSIKGSGDYGLLIGHGFYNAFYSLAFLGFHIYYFKELDKIYKEIREFEANIIKYSVIEYIEEMKKNYPNIKL